MSRLQKILSKFDGLHYPQEYLCLARESFSRPFHAYLVNNRQVIRDITASHCFTGYYPVIFSLHSLDHDPGQFIDIAFTTHCLQPNDVLNKKDAIARLTLKKIEPGGSCENGIYHYEAIKASHHFVSLLHQFVIQANNRLFSKKIGNVFLPGNLYKQVQVAYSIPRTISLITVGKDGLFNLFPTDLHGPAGDNGYIISLRHQGKACQQVMSAGRLVISQVDAGIYKTVYALGKNHMRELTSRANFPFSNNDTDTFQLPLPSAALIYRELKLEDSFPYGIHRLLHFSIVHQQTLTNTPATLAHVHNVYATWRNNNLLEGNYLLR